MHKSMIDNRTRSGLPVAFEDVCRVSRDKRVARLRHVWPDNTDGRVWSGIRQAYVRGAQELANRTDKSVEVYNAHGNMLDQFTPERDES